LLSAKFESEVVAEANKNANFHYQSASSKGMSEEGVKKVEEFMRLVFKIKDDSAGANE
jgi:hypothetical protein